MYFAPPFLGGGERYALTLARAVAQAGGDTVDVSMLSIGAEAGSTEVGGVPLQLVAPSTRVAEQLDAVSWDVLDVVDRADVVHLHHPFTRFGTSVALTARLLNKALVVTHHGAISIDSEAIADTMTLADCVVAYSAFGASRLNHRRVELVPGGVDTTRFPPIAIDRPRDRVLFVGRVVPHKGVDRLIRALPPGVALTIAGTLDHDQYRSTLAPLIASNNVEVVVKPSDAQLLELYARARAVVLPSQWVDCYGNVQMEPELMGLTVLEAAAMGTPAIVTNVGALPEYVDHGTTGLVAGDDAHLSACLAAVWADDALVARLGTAAQQRAHERWSAAIVGRRLLDLYGALVQVPA